MRNPVLILGSEPRIVVPLATALSERGIPVTVGTLSGNGTRFWSRSISSVVPLDCYMGDRGAFSQWVKREGFDLLLPVSDTALKLVSLEYNRLTQLATVACPSPEIVDRVLDKEQTLQIATRCGLQVPVSYVVNNVAELDRLHRNMRFPVVAKSRDKKLMDDSLFKIRYYLSFEDLQTAFLQDPRFGSTYLLQEYCPGEGVGVAILMHGGESIIAFQHRRLKEFPSTGGVSVFAESEPLDCSLKEQALRLLRAIGWEGIAMVEFRHDRSSDTAMLMEVNGRFWGTCSLALRAGLDLPYYVWQLAHGERPETRSIYLAGLRWRWYSGYLLRIDELLWNPRLDGQVRPPLWDEIGSSVRDLPPHAAAVWGHAAKDCGAPITSRIGEP